MPHRPLHDNARLQVGSDRISYCGTSVTSDRGPAQQQHLDWHFIGARRFKKLKARPTLVAWDHAGGLAKRVTSLQLHLSVSDYGFTGVKVTYLVKSASIETLEMHCDQPQERPQEYVFLPAPLMPLLRCLVLQELWATPSAFLQCLHRHMESLTSVSLIRCSVKSDDPTTNPSIQPVMSQEDDPTRWLTVMQELQRNSNLSFLHFDRLETRIKVTSRLTPGLEKTPHHRLDSDLSLTAIWRTTDEVTRGLDQMVTQTDCLTYVGPSTDTSLGEFAGMVRCHSLNFLFSNYKATRVYSWTQEETKVLQEYRCRDTSRPGDPYHFNEYGPLPIFAVRFPDRAKTEVVLPYLLWGKWKTVWMQYAKKSPGNW